MTKECFAVKVEIQMYQVDTNNIYYLQIEVDIFRENKHCGSDEVLNGHQPRLSSPKLPNEDRVDDGCP